MSDEELTQRQRQILNFIKDETRKRGYPPSVREIGEAIGLKSSSTVHGHLAHLEQKGMIRRDPSKPRAIEVLDGDVDHKPGRPVVNVPFLGKVTAGQPILATESIEEYLPLPQDLVGNEELFILQVRGDSMIEAGILDGDYVVVRRQSTARNGEIVVALIGDEATVKRFYREADHICLKPENSRHEPIRVRDCQILGKVAALFRRII